MMERRWCLRRGKPFSIRRVMYSPVTSSSSLIKSNYHHSKCNLRPSFRCRAASVEPIIMRAASSLPFSSRASRFKSSRTTALSWSLRTSRSRRWSPGMSRAISALCPYRVWIFQKTWSNNNWAKIMRNHRGRSTITNLMTVQSPQTW